MGIKLRWCYNVDLEWVGTFLCRFNDVKSFWWDINNNCEPECIISIVVCISSINYIGTCDDIYDTGY